MPGKTDYCDEVGYKVKEGTHYIGSLFNFMSSYIAVHGGHDEEKTVADRVEILMDVS